MEMTSMPKAAPGWTCVEPDVYIRSLSGSEAVYRAMSLQTDGSTDHIAGFSFTTTIPDIINAFLLALINLRFHVPIVAADIGPRPECENLQCAVYTPLADDAAATTWAKNSLTVHDPAPSDEEFISYLSQRRIPYLHANGHKQIAGCHLLLRPSGKHSFYVHGAHAFFDAIPSFSITRRIYEHAVRHGEAQVALPWGSEIKNLSMDLYRAGGIRMEDASKYTTSFDVPKELQMSQMSLGLLPQHNNITRLGRCVRVHQTLSRDVSAALSSQLEAHGISMTMLTDAANILTVLAMSAPLPKDAHVTQTFSVMALPKHIKHAYLRGHHVTSSILGLPLVVRASDTLPGSGTRARLLSTMKHLRAQYVRWLAHPALPLGAELTMRHPFTIQPNPYTVSIVNLGAVDSYPGVPRVTSGSGGKIETHEFQLGSRMTADYIGAVTHVWLFDDIYHLEVKAVDKYDRDYLSVYLNTLIAHMLCYLADPQIVSRL